MEYLIIAFLILVVLFLMTLTVLIGIVWLVRNKGENKKK